MDITTYCDIYTCEDCPRYGDDCDGDKRVEHTDLISRADAIEAVASITMSIHLSDVICDRLMALPSAEAVQGWIPCSERLPKEKARVLTYDSTGDIVFGQYDKGRWYWEAEACADYWARNDGVIAWMPLPKPYREDGEA